VLKLYIYIYIYAVSFLQENGDFNQQQWQHNDDQALSAAGSGINIFFSINLTLGISTKKNIGNKNKFYCCVVNYVPPQWFSFL